MSIVIKSCESIPKLPEVNFNKEWKYSLSSIKSSLSTVPSIKDKISHQIKHSVQHSRSFTEFENIALIGWGNFGYVWLVKEISTGNQYAAKVIYW